MYVCLCTYAVPMEANFRPKVTGSCELLNMCAGTKLKVPYNSGVCFVCGWPGTLNSQSSACPASRVLGLKVRTGLFWAGFPTWLVKGFKYQIVLSPRWNYFCFIPLKISSWPHWQQNRTKHDWIFLYWVRSPVCVLPHECVLGDTEAACWDVRGLLFYRAFSSYSLCSLPLSLPRPL